MLDCLIVGGGPVGLTGALYLARYRRDAVVVDDSASRARLIPQATTIRASRASPDPISWRGCVSRHSCMAPRWSMAG
jgi:thioredoxin reductase